MVRAIARPTVLLTALLGIVWVLCLPALGGTFLFDDYPNLNGLASIKADPSGYAVLQYVLGGVSSTPGRPLALLSFAAQYGSWNERPQDFIHVGILLHLLNGALWYGCLLRLQRFGAIPPLRALPLLAAALWVLAPINAGVAFYVVQRMTLLATTFVLLGLLLYLGGRAHADHPSRAYLRMGAGVLLALLPGTLSKENAALAPMLFLTLEGTLLRMVPRPARWPAWSAVFLWLPSALLLGYLAQRFPAFLQGYGSRNFGLVERLLTEARILFTYLAHAFVPETSVRAFHDDIRISASLVSPWTTASAVLGWVAISGLAIARRASWPAFAFGVGWYLIGHLLESTVVPLELAFDHRNYLPLLGVTLAVAVGAAHLREAVSNRARPLLDAAALAYLGLMAACLWLSASLWGQPLSQAREWVVRQPDSLRAVEHYGRQLLAAGDLDGAARLYEAAHRRRPEDAVIALSLFELGCFHPAIDPPLADVLRSVGARGAEIARATVTLQRLADRFADGNCPHQSSQEALLLIDTLLESPTFAAMRVPLYHASAVLLYAVGNPAAALDRLDLAIGLDPQVPILQQAILWSVQQDDTQRARAFLQLLEGSPRIDPRQRWLYRKEIQGMRQLIELYESLPEAS